MEIVWYDRVSLFELILLRGGLGFGVPPGEFGVVVVMDPSSLDCMR